MSLPIDSAAFFASASAPPTVVGPGFFPSSSSCSGLGYYPATYRDSFPWLRSRIDGFGYSAFVPEGTFKVEEARLEALKEWSAANQKREEARLKTESELEEFILSRASSEAQFWKNSLVLLDVQRQIAEAQLAKAKDTTLDQLIARKALADAERAELEKDITAKALTRKANADADRAEEEVELVKCQHKKVEKEKVKLDWEIQVVQAEKARFESEKAKFDAERVKFEAEKAKFAVEAQLATAQAAAAAAANATANATAAAPPAPPPAEKKDLIAKLTQMEPCSGGYPWIDKPNEGGFRCEGGSHFKTYAEARAMAASGKK
ncbi:hypothetical protein SCHPADRAFT_936789 [Schizopora paradoxa]|uniref:Uncharacterized protein n=1 Tax=Schizopora paradoxa TaxID=27342 RepID=A0A0H2S086_9AGAM|nr:hypothetical protein SCHPADRAFT_936789 [Schizopora paradoxa]